MPIAGIGERLRSLSPKAFVSQVRFLPRYFFSYLGISVGKLLLVTPPHDAADQFSRETENI